MESRSLGIQCKPGVVGTHLNLPVSEDAADAAIEASTRKHRCDWVGQVQYSLHHRCHTLETWETFAEKNHISISVYRQSREFTGPTASSFRR